MKKEVLLVNEQDEPLMRMEKMEAHQKALLHRAFSVFLYHDDQILLQQRAQTKYHCGGLWTNICCSHPLEGDVIPYAHIRLKEETGIQDVSLEEIGHLLYRAEFSNGLCEFEYDHILLGEYKEDNILFDPLEIQAVKWMSIKDLHQDAIKHPASYTPWFLQVIEKVVEEIEKRNQMRS